MAKFVHGKITLQHFNDMVARIRETEDDRTCGILAGAFLDNLLFDLLDRCLPYSPVANREALFDFNGPLGPFAHKIQMAHFMGLLTVGDVASLTVVRDIRNMCAHSLGIREDQVIDFEHPSILERLRKFYPPKILQELPKEVREHLTAARDTSLEVLGGRMFFTTFFCHVSLSIFARIQIITPFQLPDEIDAELNE